MAKWVLTRVGSTRSSDLATADIMQKVNRSIVSKPNMHSCILSLSVAICNENYVIRALEYAELFRIVPFGAGEQLNYL